MPLIDTPPDALAQIYARSLFQLAESDGGRELIERVQGEFEDVLELARADAAFSEFLASRVLPVKVREASLRRIFEATLNPLLLRFLLVLNAKQRLSHLQPIGAAFDAMVQERFGRVEVDVYTAWPLDQAELGAIRERLRTALGREPILHPYTDGKMLGGIRLQVGDRLIDGSLAMRIRKVRDLLASQGAARLRSRAAEIIEDAATYEELEHAAPAAEPVLEAKPSPGEPARRPAAAPAAAAARGALRIAKKVIADIDVKDRRILIRVDFNVPAEGGQITDDRRIREAIPTIRSILERGGSAVLMSHLGRPKGTGFQEEFTLRPCAQRLGELLGTPVEFPSNDCTDADAASAVAALGPGGVLLLENLRFHAEEKEGDPGFAARLAAYGETYVNDAFGTCHRPDASMVAVPKAMSGRPRIAGLLLEKELAFLGEALRSPARPFVVVLGGAKVSDKIGAIENLLPRADSVLIGGAMAYTFLAALGRRVGESKVETRHLAAAKRILDLAARLKSDLHLPKDHICSTVFAESGGRIQVCSDHIPDGSFGLDIGPATQSAYHSILAKARTIVWNGPMGVFEWMPFRVGTQQVGRALAEATRAGATTIVGGGDSAAALERFGLAGSVSHVSTGGGASIEMLEGKTFESVALLDDA